MAEQQQQGVALKEDKFCCSVCLDLLMEPVSLTCGHSFCSSCLQGCWSQNQGKGLYNCPQCKESFSQRPVLKKNSMLAEVVEKLKKTGVQQTSPSAAPTHTGPGDVPCDFCTVTRRQKALMSCLTCLGSYCETHLQPHYSVPVLKKHKLVKAAAQLQERMCSSHDKLLDVFCRTDQQCICLLCMDDHRGHDTVSAAAERTEKQKQLGKRQRQAHQKVQEREKELKELRQTVESLKRSAQTAVEVSEKVFTELIQSIKKRRNEVKRLLRAQEKTVVSQAEGLLEQLEQEIAELRRTDAELKQLSHTDDNIRFIQTLQSLSSGPSDVPIITSRPLNTFREVTDVVSDMGDKLENILKETWPTISSRVSAVDIWAPPEPRTRADFLTYACPLSLDLNTINNYISLSEENRKVTGTGQEHRYPDHPDRFTVYSQVLCREGQSACCYWEVEWSGDGMDAAVSYKNIYRKGGKKSCFGFNDKSWSLECSKTNGYWFIHNNVRTKVEGPQSYRIGIYLDYKAGRLSFYSVSGTMTLLHTVQTTFTRALYPGLNVWSSEGTAKLC